MNQDQIDGTIKKVAGTAQEAIGKVANDQQLDAKGKLNQAVGSVQDGYGKVRDKVKDLIDDAPATARDAVGTGRDYVRRGAVAVTSTAGDNGALILLAAGLAGAALGWFAFRRRGSGKKDA